MTAPKLPLCRLPTTAFRADQHTNADLANKAMEPAPPQPSCSAACRLAARTAGVPTPVEARKLSVWSAWTSTSGDAPGTSCRSAAGRTPPGAPAAGATQTPAAPAPPSLPARRSKALPFVNVAEAPSHPRSTYTICRGVARWTPPGARAAARREVRPLQLRRCALPAAAVFPFARQFTNVALR